MTPTVFIVDDDAAIRDALGLLLGLKGYRTAIYASAEDFLSAWQVDWYGCLLVDIRMPGMDGLSFLEKLKERCCEIPAVVLTGHGDVEAARRAFRASAIDFLEKPINENELLRAVEEAMKSQRSLRDKQSKSEAYSRQVETLTPRERQVMDMVVAGMHNRDVAKTLAISVRTVEVHKARILQKLNVPNVTSLVRMHLLDDGAGRTSS